jgi:hypothetical protein
MESRLEVITPLALKTGTVRGLLEQFVDNL